MLHHQGITGSECNISCTYIHVIVPVDSKHSNYCARTGAKSELQFADSSLYLDGKEDEHLTIVSYIAL